MVRRHRKAKTLSLSIRTFLKSNPGIAKALRSFGMSYEQYQRSLSGTSFYTTTSTTPSSSVGNRNRVK